MAVYELFSYRKRLAAGDVTDVFVYDDLPHELRVQIIHIWSGAIGRLNAQGWSFIESVVAREHGRFQLGREVDEFDRCTSYLLKSDSVDLALDLVEFSFRCIERVTSHLMPFQREGLGITVSAPNAIDELNERFRRAGVGYRYEDGCIMRVDSELLHAEVVRPALQFLHQNGFEGPRDEFLSAFNHFKKGENREAITDANNAFESTLKAICDQRGWDYSPGSRASDLLKIVRSNGLLPSYLDNSFGQLAATLKSGLPEVRNNQGAHGQGPVPTETPDYVAAYALHLAATNILFLAEAHRHCGA